MRVKSTCLRHQILDQVRQLGTLPAQEPRRRRRCRRPLFSLLLIWISVLYDTDIPQGHNLHDTMTSATSTPRLYHSHAGPRPAVARWEANL
jgi:hypothetical protein